MSQNMSRSACFLTAVVPASAVHSRDAIELQPYMTCISVHNIPAPLRWLAYQP